MKHSVAFSQKLDLPVDLFGVASVGGGERASIGAIVRPKGRNRIVYSRIVGGEEGW